MLQCPCTVQMKNSRKEQNNCRNTAQNDNMFVYTTIAKFNNTTILFRKQPIFTRESMEM